jgi:hypothetical protein
MLASAPALPLATDCPLEIPRLQPVPPPVHPPSDLCGTAATTKAGPAAAPLQVTPELMEFYRNRAHDLRAEAIRNAESSVWSFLTRIVGPR